MAGYQLTVKELRERIKDLPDDMPVGYQRIEDSYFEPNRWTTETVVWEHWPGRDPDYTEWIGAFSAMVTRDLNGKKYLMVHAHYGIEILLHIYYSPEPHPDSQFPNAAWSIAMKWLTDEGLIEQRNTDRWHTTERGNVYVEALREVPLPERLWVMPKPYPQPALSPR